MSRNRCEAKDPANCKFHRPKLFPLPAPSSAEEHFNESKKFEFVVNANQKEALEGYLDNDYMDMTPVLYGASDYKKDKFLKQADLIQEAIETYEAVSDKKPKTVYRATRLKAGHSFNSPEEMKDFVEKNFKPGSVITTAGFTSTTVRPEVLFDFLPDGHNDYVINNPKKEMSSKRYHELMGSDESLNNLVYEISTPSGVAVSSFGHSHATREQEYLLGRNKRFVIKEVLPISRLDNPAERPFRKHAHATIIKLEEIV